MKVLIDTDILIDVALDRAPYAEAAGRVLDFVEKHHEMAYIAWHSASNLHYIVSSPKGNQSARDFIKSLLEFIGVASVGTDDLVYALGLNMPDYEDAMQAASAVACRADYIITRNTPDYRHSPVKAISPTEWLKKYAGNT